MTDRLTSSFPSIDNARCITESALSTSVKKLERFNTGNHHFVYDVLLDNGENVVSRIALPQEVKAFEGALYWSELLKPRGVPLPDILCSDITCTQFSFPYIILQRLPGTDLGHVYNNISVAQRRTLVSELVGIQKIATNLPQGSGFGYVERLDGPFPYHSWRSLIEDALSRTYERFFESGFCDHRIVETIEKLAGEFKDYFEDVQPNPFLHDMTSKNVLVNKGKLMGIVDVDSLCFGDQLYLPGLIQATFLADRLPSDYIEYWKEALHLDEHQQRVVDFYSAQCLAYIMGEMGLQLNQEQCKAPDVHGLHYLQEKQFLLFESLGVNTDTNS